LNPQDPLAALHPLRVPDLIGWWPLAPGWWVLIALLALALVALAYLLYRTYTANGYRRTAAQQLQDIHRQWLADGDSLQYTVAVNGLLKSVALRAYPNRDVASFSGPRWIRFLNDGLLAQGLSFSDSFANAAYQKQVASSDCESLRDTALRWINTHKVAAP
jgi:hypothetical protein